MSTSLSVDLISDLNLTKSDQFDWDGKATSLFCIVAGNISNDINIVKHVLEHLSDRYRGVFFIDGGLEHVILDEYDDRIAEIKQVCDSINNVVYLHNHVVMLNRVALVAINGWYGNKTAVTADDDEFLEIFRMSDVSYLSTTIQKLQEVEDVERIVVVSNSVPSEVLTFNNSKVKYPGQLGPAVSLLFDRESKVSQWLFGSDTISVDTVINSRLYVNNPCCHKTPYWPKRVVI